MDSIKKLTDLFSKFPGIGKRTAGRFVFYLINSPKTQIDEFIGAITELKNSIALCAFCFNPHEATESLCSICADPLRNQQVLCLIEKEADLLSIEATKRYKGRYFILGGTVTLRNTDGANLRIEALKDRVQKGNFTEIIIATNPTQEGKLTGSLIERNLKELSKIQTIKITHLAQGLPVGGELEYADEETLESAFEGRR